MPLKIVERGTDKLITVDVTSLSESTPADIIKAASIAEPYFANYTPDGCGVIVLFHTPDHRVHGLGGLRKNPALNDLRTSRGDEFPSQINTTIGGRLTDSSLPLLNSFISAIKYKTFFEEEIQDSPIVDSQRILHELVAEIENSAGWSSEVCIHTDYWQNRDGTEGKMCFLTGIKHINATYAQLSTIENALGSIMKYKEDNNESPRNLTNFKFYPFIETMQTATESALIKLTELEKAEEGLNRGVMVTFNDLCLAVFQLNESYTKFSDCRELILSAEGEENLTLRR